jgi:hypothetical protein
MPRNGSGFSTVAARAPAVLVPDCEAFSVNSLVWVKHLLQRQATLRSNDDGIGLDPSSLGKVCGDVLFTFYRDLARPSLVALLLFLACPATVLRAIALTIVNAVQRIAIRPLAHVSNEVVKPNLWQLPSLTNSNASAAIILILLRARIATAFNHAAPNCVQGMRISEWHVNLAIFARF